MTPAIVTEQNQHGCWFIVKLLPYGRKSYWSYGWRQPELWSSCETCHTYQTEVEALQQIERIKACNMS